MPIGALTGIDHVAVGAMEKAWPQDWAGLDYPSGPLRNIRGARTVTTRGTTYSRISSKEYGRATIFCIP